MKRGAIVAGLASMLMAFGCGTDVDLGNRPAFKDGTAVLSVVVYSGMDGSALNNAAVSLRIGPKVLTAVASGNVYTIENVPTAGSNAFPITITAPGFLEFVGKLPAALTAGTLQQPTYTTKVALMFPTGQAASDYKIKLYDNVGAPVASGTVQVALSAPTMASFSQGFEQTMADSLDGNYGFKPNVKSYTIANGEVTMPIADIIFGATYKVTAYNLKNAAGSFLTPELTAATIKPTTDYPQSEIYAGVPTRNPVVVAISNETATQKATAATQLEVTFAMDVETCNDKGVLDFYDVLYATDTVTYDFTPSCGATTGTPQCPSGCSAALAAVTPAVCPSSTMDRAFDGTTYKYFNRANVDLWLTEATLQAGEVDTDIVVAGNKITFKPKTKNVDAADTVAVGLKNVKVRIKGATLDSDCQQLFGQGAGAGLKIRDTANNAHGGFYYTNP